MNDVQFIPDEEVSHDVVMVTARFESRAEAVLVPPEAARQLIDRLERPGPEPFSTANGVKFINFAKADTIEFTGDAKAIQEIARAEGWACFPTVAKNN